MKKLLIILFACLGIGVFATNAGQRYTVIVTFQYIHNYVSKSSGVHVGTEYGRTETASYSIYADTKNEAEEQAKSQCSGTCSSGFPGNYQGDKNYNGEQCKVYLQRQILTARAQ